MAGLFSLSSKNSYDIVRILGSRIFITVHHLKLHRFVADSHSLIFYGNHLGNFLAFEVNLISRECTDHDVSKVTAAIKWYAKEKLDYPGMDLQLKDPRPILSLLPVN